MTTYNFKQPKTWLEKYGKKGDLISQRPLRQTLIPKDQPKVSLIDVLKEIPRSTRMVITKIGRFAKDVQEEMARSGASVGLTAMTPFISEERQTALIEKDPKLKKYKDILFGKRPLESIQARIARGELKAKEIGEKYKIETFKKYPLPVSVVGIGAIIALDFTGMGGKKNVAKILTKVGKVDDVAKLLKGINVADDLIPTYSKVIAKLNKTDDVLRALDKIVDIQKTTRTIRPIKEVAKQVPKERQFLQSVARAKPSISLRVGGQYIPRSTDDLAIKAKNLIKDNIEVAEDWARTKTDDKAVATAAELIKHYSDEAIKTTNKAIKNTLYEKAANIAHITAENLTEQGRAIQASSIMGNLTPEGILRFAAREIDKYNEAILKSKGLFGLKKRIPKLTAEQTETILKEFKKIENMTDGTEKAIAFKKLNDTISDLIPASLYKKAINVWKAGLLTGVKTSGLNTFSNLFHGVSETIKDVPGAVVDSVASLFTKKRTLAFTARGKGGLQEGFEKGWRYLNTGFDERNVGIKLDWRRVNFGDSKLAKGLQKYEETIFHLMGAEDQPFYYGAKARSLQSQAIAQAKNLKLKGKAAAKYIDDLVANPTDKMLRYAAADAEIAVFQNPTLLGKIAKTIQNLPGGEIIVPFGRTPASVANQFINYTPVGIVKAIVSNIRKGKFDQRLFSQAMGRGIIGTEIMYVGTKLFEKGMLTLDYPKGEREQKLWQAEGKKPNSIKIGDKWRSVAVLGPGGFTLVAGGYFKKALDETGSIISALGSSVVGGVKSVKDQTFLQGISAFVKAIDDPNKVETWFASTISSAIPTLVGDIARAFDPLERRATGLFGRLKAKIPRIRETLEPQITVLGEERLRAGNWLETMIDPSRPSKIITGNVVVELRRLTIAGYEVSPTLLGDREGYKGLTPEENTAMWKRVGELINSKLGNLFNLKQYKNLPDDKKADVVERVIGKSKVIARSQTVLELTEGLKGKALKDKLSELKAGGLMTREVFEQYLEFEGEAPAELEGQPTTERGEGVPSFKEGVKLKYGDLIHDLVLYAKAIKTDPVTAFSRIFTGQKIRRIDANTIIVERLPFEESQEVRAERGATDELILDHTIPLQLGGSNSEGNLKLVPIEEWKRYTPVENFLGGLIRQGKINKKEAQRLIRDFKDGKISQEEIFKY